MLKKNKRRKDTGLSERLRGYHVCVEIVKIDRSCAGQERHEGAAKSSRNEGSVGDCAKKWLQMAPSMA